MKPSTKGRVKGKFHELKGSVKEQTGKLTNDPELEVAGKAEKIAGKVQGKVAQVTRIFGK
jgi:uncharacterized protein YjbJ (UPF0337 family)